MERSVGALLLCTAALWTGSVWTLAAGQQSRRASQAPPPTTTAQTYPREQIDAGAPVFASRCGFCHGRDAAGGETGPDLTRSTLVGEDVRGDKLTPVIRDGRTEKGMPGFSLSPTDLANVVAFIHAQKTKAESQEGTRRSVDDADLDTGNADAGRAFFSGAGGCAACHSPTGDLAGVATRLEGLKLLQQMLYPRPFQGGTPAAKATVTGTTRAGDAVSGALVYRDEFVIALTDRDGRYRSFFTDQLTFTVSDPLDAHRTLLGNYTDESMHNVLAYLRTLR